jgi:hypothetical protein
MSAKGRESAAQLNDHERTRGDTDDHENTGTTNHGPQQDVVK